MRRFGLKTGVLFAYFGLESGMVFFRELRHLLECMKVFIVSKREREICEFEMDLTNFLFAGGGKFVRVCNCGVASIVFSGKSGGKKNISLHVFPNGMRHFENTPIYNEFRKFILRLFVCVPRVFFCWLKTRKMRGTGASCPNSHDGRRYCKRLKLMMINTL